MMFRMSRPRVVCLGDSITQRGHDVTTGGWLSLLQSQLCRSVDLVNRGFSGYNTDWLLAEFDTIKSDFAAAALVVILMGANDSAADVQHVPLARFKTNMIELVRKCKDAGAAKVVLVTTPWVDGPAWLEFCRNDQTSSQFGQSEPNRCAAEAKKYSQAGSCNILFLSRWRVHHINQSLDCKARMKRIGIRIGIKILGSQT